jgi:hypothetical protein
VIEIGTNRPMANLTMWRGTLTDEQVEIVTRGRRRAIAIRRPWVRDLARLCSRLRLFRVAEWLTKRNRTVVVWNEPAGPAR